ncbi:MAG TPA: hypothetical protein VGY55_24885, partial [Pirellulales bacterium]|nr:hypothetical protein [Pirellulales bacterium]
MSDLEQESAEFDTDHGAPTMQTRIDPPHVILVAPEGVDAVLPEPEESGEARQAATVRETVAVGESVGFETPASSWAAEQLQLQAEQLADHLRAQQEQIDRREADLHAQLAQHENGSRNARLWFRERQQELTEREAEIARRELEIAAKEEALARADREQAESRERIKTDLRRQNEALGSRQRELDERGSALDRQETENAAISAALVRSAAEQEQLDARLREREQNLEEAEALLCDSQSELDGARQQLDADRRAWQDRCDAERREAAQAHDRAELELEKKLHAIKARAEHLERRTAAVDQLRAEVIRTQRESLELRLATDELWAQMMGVAPPAALSQSLAQIRGKLAEQYRLERAEIAGQKQDLEMLATRLEAERERIQHQKQELEQWGANRQADIEGQAARLAAREQQLDRRQ